MPPKTSWQLESTLQATMVSQPLQSDVTLKLLKALLEEI